MAVPSITHMNGSFLLTAFHLVCLFRSVMQAQTGSSRPLLGRRGAAANFLEADILRDVRGYISANPATVQSDVLQLPNGIVRSRHEQRVYAIHNTAFMDTVIPAAAARIARFVAAMGLNKRPLGFRQHRTFHPRLESQAKPHVNPHGP